MYRSNMRFSLIFGALCLCGTHAFAVPSVRVLGANNSGSKVVPAKTGDNLNRAGTVGTVKKASVKTVAPVQAQQVLSPTTNRVGTTGATGNARLPIITTKANIQSALKPGTATVSPNTSNAKFDEISERIDSLQLQVDGKLTSADLDGYYTKDEIDDINSDYYTATEVDEKLSGLGDLVSGNEETLSGISNRVTANETDVSDIKTRLSGFGNQLNNVSERVNGTNSNILTINGQIADINTRIDNIDTISSLQYIQGVKDKMSEYESKIGGYEFQLEQMGGVVTNVINNSKMLYDAETNTYVTVSIVDTFDEGVLMQHLNSNNNL